MKTKTAYKKELLTYAKNLRKTQTQAERVLWSNIRNKQINNIKFRRQVPILNYIVDFYSEELKLIIEIDGSSHDEKKYDYDQMRESNLKALGLNVLRFTEYEVTSRLHDTLQSIENYIEEFTSPRPSPQGEGEITF